MTLRELILWSEQQMLAAGLHFGHGTSNALDESAWLVSHAAGLSVNFGDEALDIPLSAEQQQAALQLLETRIEKRQPLSYLINEAWFAGHRFMVNEQVLVPRSPIAELIYTGYAPWVEPDRIGRVLDLCTGSGCIAIATALAMPGVTVDATDISPPALEVARQNVALHDLEGRVRVVESDLFSALAGQRYDLIVSNPPYVDAEDMAALPAEYRAEPGLALAAGQDGLDLVVPMLQQAAEHLTPDGVLIVEVGNSDEALAARFPEVPFTWLEFTHGGHGVFQIDARQLAACREILDEG